MFLPNCPLKGPETDCRLLPDGRERTATAPDFPCVVGADFYLGNSCSLHWHEEFELVLVRSGTLTAAINGANCVLAAGEGIFVNTGVLHSYAELEGKGAEVTYVLFLPGLVGGPSGSVFWKKYLDPLVSSLQISAVELRNAPWQRQILEQTGAIASLHQEEPPGFEIEIRAHLSRITHVLCERAVAAGGPESERLSEAAQTMRQMLSYLEANFMRPIHIDEIAASGHVSTRSCQRLFQRFTSRSPKQFLISLRLEKARQLLRETTLGIPEISAECGFADQSYFTKVFRRSCGCPPALFRRRACERPTTSMGTS